MSFRCCESPRRFLSRWLAVLFVALLGHSAALLGGVGAWTPINDPGGQLTSIALDPNRPGLMYASRVTACGPWPCFVGEVFKSVDRGHTWTNASRGLGGGFVRSLSIAFDSSAIFAVTQNAVFKSSDDGGNWTPVLAGVGPPFSLASVVVSPRNSSVVYAGASEYGCDNPCVFKSTDAGSTWRNLPSGLPVYDDTSDFAIDPANPETVYAAGYNLRKSIDGGASWSLVSIDTNYLTSVAFEKRDSATLYAGSEGNGILRSTDAGASWERLLAGRLRVRTSPFRGGTVYAVSDSTVLESSSSGDTWIPRNNGLEGKHIAAFQVDPTDPLRLYALASDTAGSDCRIMEYRIAAFESSGPCQSDNATLCLHDNRFEVSARWSAGGVTGTAQASPLSGDAGYFSFFDAANVELLVKLVDGCGINARTWVFAGGLTDAGVVLKVRDTWTGAEKSYTNEPNTPFETVQDIDAFKCDGELAFSQSTRSPAKERAARDLTCGGDGKSLCLSGGRYRVEARWAAPDGSGGEAEALPLTEEAGAFWFFSPGNPEVAVKIVSGCAFNSRVWVFAGGLTNLEVDLTVTDTVTGVSRTYRNPQGVAFQPIQDTDAFEGCL